MPAEASRPNESRQDICRRTAAALRAADPSRLRAVIGYDGFVDNLMRVVDRRLSADSFEPVRTIAALGHRIVDAAGHSSNIELVLKTQKLGGNGPIFANALATLGAGVTYIGNVGYPAVAPVFNDFVRHATVYGVAEPGVTDALEFDDGKLMLNKNETLADVTWQNVTDRVGFDKLVAAYDDATLLGMANWTMLPHLSDIWRKLLSEVMPKLSKAHTRHLYVDLADPAKRTDEHLREAVDLLGEFQKHVRVVLGLNANEIRRIAKLDGVNDLDTDDLVALNRLRDRLGLHGLVIHHRRGAVAVTDDAGGRISGPFVRRPVITTGAGDHFNSGFCLGLGSGLSLLESLCCGVAVGGYYVSRAESPTRTALADFIDRLPEPEPDAE